MNERTREIVVIGGGPAGVSAAIEAARAGAAVSLVTDEEIGGRATFSSLVPSKVLLHAIAERRVVGPRPPAGPDGATAAEIASDIERVIAAESRRLRARLEDAGVAVVRGVARFESTSRIAVSRAGAAERALAFDAVVLATGSVPTFPAGFFGPQSGPDGQRVLLPRHLPELLRALPASLLVIGGGATGAELACAANALGVEVTWILDELGILPEADRELADSVGDVLMERGIKIVHGKRVLHVRVENDRALAALDGGRTYAADRALVAIGRKPDLTRLGLDAIDLAPSPETGRLEVDGELRTASSRVFAIGDVVGSIMSAGKATLEGWIAGRAAAGQAVPTTSRDAFVIAIYTDPEIAFVGLTPERALRRGQRIDVRTIGFDESVAGLLEGVGSDPRARGWLRLVVDADSAAILGATAIGPHAAEVLGPIAVAIRARAGIDALATAALASPSFGELASRAARA